MNPEEIKSAEEILEKQGFKIMCHKKDDDVLHDIFIKPLLEAMQIYARQESERRIDEFIEKIVNGFIAKNYFEDIGIVAYEFKDWLKSLKSK